MSAACDSIPCADSLALPGEDLAYPYRLAIQTRWGDLDPFAHVNNVTYYRFFEATLVTFLEEKAGLDLLSAPVIPFVAENRCRFLRPLARTGGGTWVEGGLRVARLGTTSVTYGLALFASGTGEVAALGAWVQVFVERASGRPAPVPPSVRTALETLGRETTAI
ncbi:acyl-CoA thioesterase [Pararhodospirillum oryzae]|uniref:Thioesterase n=1 Tax=Pararhodospirillum oryzae TaxID=478448 RepID=A0A512H9H4_9PROT|nr:thioesterase family protein [Pararhodospirillum oryzae]GEO82092.1 thioesterase [Pararhodospirillum oryzae]